MEEFKTITIFNYAHEMVIKHFIRARSNSFFFENENLVLVDLFDLHMANQTQNSFQRF
jgi:hypothetical protein